MRESSRPQKRRPQPEHPKRTITAGHLQRGLLFWLPLAAACASGITGSERAEEDTPPAPAVDAPGVADALAPATRFARLTHVQWENSVRDLLLLDETSDLSLAFPADARSAGFIFDNATESLQTDQVLYNAYAGAAELLAARVALDPPALARLLPRPSAGADPARAFIETFGERAFRRPLTEDEVQAFLGLYAIGTSAYDDVSGMQAGLRLLIQAFLQSPNFLYRIESSTRAVQASVPLSSWEVGQRLSYFITNSLPDAELLGRAGAGELTTPDSVRAQAVRLFATPAARPALVGFHDQLFEFEKYASIAPSALAFPDIEPGFAEDVLASSRAFIEDIAFSGGGFADLMTSTEAFVNDRLAPVYGVGGEFGEDLVKVELPRNERRGLFNQIGFLAANATSVQPDPIHRGVFMATRVLCLGLPAPPDGVPPLPPVVEGTNRQVVANHTESAALCRGCHQTVINPLGFPFEHYDATGAYRTIDNGLPVDSSSSMTIDGKAVALGNSLDLAEALATSRQAHECFVSHLVEYALGRPRNPLDQPLIERLTRASLDGSSIVNLALALTEDPAFLSRSTEELE
jgi:hypothetical protein